MILQTVAYNHMKVECL